MLTQLKDHDVSGKRVLVRVDLNVAIAREGLITGDFRIRASLPTIQYLLSQKSRVILMSHLGKPKGKPAAHLTLRPVAERLASLLKAPVQFVSTCWGDEASHRIERLESGEILLLENLRFFLGEEKNDGEFAKALASLGDFYVNDAFASSHRVHASIVGIPKFLPHAPGLLLEKEIEILTKVRDNPARPLVVVLGGGKIATKLPFLKHFLAWADGILLGGAMANTVLKATGLSLGKSLVEEGMVEDLKAFDITSAKLHLPVDAVFSEDPSGKAPIRIDAAGDIRPYEMFLDIGPDTRELYAHVIKNAGTVLWNGPMGVREVPAFVRGTEVVARAVAETQAFSIVGGGDSTVVLRKLGLLKKIDYVSSGGGAMLEFLTGKELPGITALKLPDPNYEKSQ